MDDSDASRAADGSLGEELTPAVRRIDPVEREGANGDPFDEQLTPAVRRIPAEERTSGTSEGVSVDVTDIEELVGPQQTLEPRIQIVWILQSGISAAVLAVIATIGLSVLQVGEPWFGSAIFTVFFLLGVVFAVLRYRIWRYQVRDDSLFLRRGVVTRVTTVAPYVRIQHVDVRRGAIERTFGLATTVVYTAGSRGADVSIPGLTPERANDLQTRLKQLAIAAEGEDAV